MTQNKLHKNKQTHIKRKVLVCKCVFCVGDIFFTFHTVWKSSSIYLSLSVHVLVKVGHESPVLLWEVHETVQTESHG